METLKTDFDLTIKESFLSLIVVQKYSCLTGSELAPCHWALSGAGQVKTGSRRWRMLSVGNAGGFGGF